MCDIGNEYSQGAVAVKVTMGLVSYWSLVFIFTYEGGDALQLGR